MKRNALCMDILETEDIPPEKSGGSVEASCVPFVVPFVITHIPPEKSGGSVEARRGDHYLRSHQTFRLRNQAAPLKLMRGLWG